jgi:hypothetical protein
LDSSTIPFVFRSKINDIEHTLDGGICENLPTEPLLMDKEKYGDVVVMSFEKSKNSLPNGTLKLAETILDIMINHTVERAVSGLPHDSVCRIPTSLKTLDFSRVCSIGMSDPAYDLAKKSVSSWIRDWVDRSSTRAIGINVGEYQKNVKTISDAYQKEFLIHRSALIVVARSLGNGMGQFDDVFSLTDIEPLQEGMLVHREFLGRADGSSDNTDWSVRSMNGVSVGPSIPVTILPGKGEAPGHLDACLFFESPLKLNKIYRVEAKSRTRNAFEKLRTAGADYLSNTLERKNTKALAFDLVLAVPDKTVLSMDAGGRGHELTEQEMVDSLYKNLIPGGFRAYGWRAENMVQGETLRVDYRRK